MKKAIALTLFLLVGFIMGGCVSVRVNSSVAPNFDLKQLKTFYVKKQDADKRDLEKLIAAQLKKMGYSAQSGNATQPNTPVDAVVTYEDRWMWDITMYLLEMKIYLREPQTDFVLASGYSFRTSLARKPPEFMIEEALNKIFGLPLPTSE